MVNLHLPMLVRDNRKKASMKRILIALAGVATIVGLGIPAAAPASASSYPLWCGSWVPNPQASGVLVTARPVNSGTGPDGSSWQIMEATKISTGQQFLWARISNGHPGEQIAFLWEYTNNRSWYQCGNAQSKRVAIVAPGSTSTWTSAVPTSQVEGYNCQFWAENGDYSYCF
jgi:hypothetical protein